MCSRVNNIKVLVAEDDSNERKIIYEFLSNLNYIDDIDCVCNGSEAVTKILSENYNLLILDFVMENKDGLEVLEFINKNKLKTSLKIIVISAIGKTEIIKKAFETGADYYLKKSFNFEHLKNIIYNLFNNNNLNNFKSENLIIQKLGIPANLLGCKYIAQILKIIKYENVNISEAYRKIAKFNNTSCECVEINVRNAIKHAHKVQNNYYLKIFGESKNSKKPKNSIFLYTIAELDIF